MKHLLSLILLLGLNCGLLTAQDFGALLRSANEAYQRGAYRQAIETYQRVLEEGMHSATLYYNLGNSYFRNDELGLAILNYERALLLAPNEKDIRYNLSLANDKIVDRVEAIPEFFLARWWDYWRLRFGAATWAILGLVCLWIGMICFIAWILGETRKTRIYGFTIGVILILFSVLPFSLAFSRKVYERNTDRAILMVDAIALRSAPDRDSRSILPIHEGSKVKLLDVIGDWYKVQLRDGEIGWLPSTSVEEI